MRIVDANVLLHAVNSDSEHHDSARRWLDAALAGATTVGFSWSVILAFLRVSSHPAVFSRALTPEDALTTLRAWLAQPAAAVVDPSARHPDVLAGLLLSAGTAGNLVNDAHLAAIAVENGAELISYDTDFQRFAGLAWHTPG